jgi:hypothetical protein
MSQQIPSGGRRSDPGDSGTGRASAGKARGPAHAPSGAELDYPFRWGVGWKQCVEYRVDDFSSEIAFFIDTLGFPTNAFGPDYAMFTSPDQAFYFSVVPAPPGESSTPPASIRLQFMIENIVGVVSDLERRGIVFEERPGPWEPGSPLYTGYFRTPHGICIDLWGMVA